MINSAVLIFCCVFALVAVGSSLPASPPDQSARDAGKNLFERHCALCHGMDGSGGRGPSLRRARLSHAPDDAALRALISDGIPPDMPDGWFLTEEDVRSIAAYVRSLGALPSAPLPGDRNHGSQVYVNRGCANCHILAGRGHAFGPELTAIGERRSASFIRQAILDPTATLARNSGGWTITSQPILGFLLVEAVTANGERIRGLRVNEDSFTIQIEDSADRFHSLRKEDLKELRKFRGITPMPSYKGTLTEPELQDLIAYLASQGSQR